MYGNEPARWDDNLVGVDRWRCVVNSLTRLRFCSGKTAPWSSRPKEGVAGPPAGYPCLGLKCLGGAPSYPLRSVIGPTLGLINRDDLMALDTGLRLGRATDRCACRWRHA